MPTRKQRRRRAKEKRHEYEYVYVDDEGNEVEVEEASSKNGKAPAAKAAKPTTRAGRVLEPPTWRRTLRRGALFAPLMFLVVILMSPDGMTLVQQVVQTLLLLLFFLPFSYLMDSIVWRSFQRRLSKQQKR